MLVPDTRRVLDAVVEWAEKWGCRRRAYIDVLMDCAPAVLAYPTRWFGGGHRGAVRRGRPAPT